MKRRIQRRQANLRRSRGAQRTGAAQNRLRWVIVGGAAVIAVATIAAWYSTRQEEGPVVDPAPVTSERISQGQKVYADHCASCHGADLEGQPEWRTRLPSGAYPAPPHDETGHTWHHPDEFLFDVVKRGGQPTAPPGFVSAMPAFGDVLSDDEIWAVLAFIKSRWSDDARKWQRLQSRR